MTKKEKFIKLVQEEIFNDEPIYIDKYEEDWEDIVSFWKSFKEEKKVTKVTEKGQAVLVCMQTNTTAEKDFFTAKDIAEILFVSPRSVSGTMKKLITEGYVEKEQGNPITYRLTEKGQNFKEE